MPYCCTRALELLAAVGPVSYVLVDKAYDAIVEAVAQAGAEG